MPFFAKHLKPAFRPGICDQQLTVAKLRQIPFPHCYNEIRCSINCITGITAPLFPIIPVCYTCFEPRLDVDSLNEKELYATWWFFVLHLKAWERWNVFVGYTVTVEALIYYMIYAKRIKKIHHRCVTHKPSKVRASRWSDTVITKNYFTTWLNDVTFFVQFLK